MQQGRSRPGAGRLQQAPLVPGLPPQAHHRHMAHLQKRLHRLEVQLQKLFERMASGSEQRKEQQQQRLHAAQQRGQPGWQLPAQIQPQRTAGGMMAGGPLSPRLPPLLESPPAWELSEPTLRLPLGASGARSAAGQGAGTASSATAAGAAAAAAPAGPCSFVLPALVNPGREQRQGSSPSTPRLRMLSLDAGMGRHHSVPHGVQQGPPLLWPSPPTPAAASPAAQQQQQRRSGLWEPQQLRVQQPWQLQPPNSAHASEQAPPGGGSPGTAAAPPLPAGAGSGRSPALERLKQAQLHSPLPARRRTTQSGGAEEPAQSGHTAADRPLPQAEAKAGMQSRAAPAGAGSSPSALGVVHARQHPQAGPGGASASQTSGGESGAGPAVAALHALKQRRRESMAGQLSAADRPTTALF